MSLGVRNLRIGSAFASVDTHVRTYPTVQAVVRSGEVLAQRMAGRLGLKI